MRKCKIKTFFPIVLCIRLLKYETNIYISAKLTIVNVIQIEFKLFPQQDA